MIVWRGLNPLILASQSRARQMLLTNAGIAFESIPAAIDERAIQETSGVTSPAGIARLLAREKALAVTRQRPGHFVVGADQTLALRERVFNKPTNRAEAFAQLKALAGQVHELHSAVVVARDGKIMFDHVAVAHLTMRHLGDAGIDAYLRQAGEAVVTSSVGAYQLEGLGVHLFEHIDGDHFTILGLPLLPLLGFLRNQSQLAL
jgi:septum formation protein